MSKNITKAEAANVLSDEIFDLSIAIEKARVVMQEITNGYFQKLSNEVEGDRTSILWDFNRVGVFAEIADDLMLKMCQIVEELNGLKNADTKEEKVARQAQNITSAVSPTFAPVCLRRSLKEPIVGRERSG